MQQTLDDIVDDIVDPDTNEGKSSDEDEDIEPIE